MPLEARRLEGGGSAPGGEPEVLASTDPERPGQVVEEGTAFAPASTTGWEAYRDRLDYLFDRAIAEYVRDVALDIIATESPIEAGRLARIIGNRFGFQRVVAKRAAEILRVVPQQLRRESELGAFYWAEGTGPESYQTFRRTPEGVPRPLAEVAPEEIANAMASIVRASHGITTGELLRETATVFGTGRLTSPVKARLEAVLAWAVREGRVRPDGERVLS